MCWPDVRLAHPDRWLVIEALERDTERVAVLDVCPDGLVVIKRWRELRHRHPGRALYCVHTGKPTLELR